MEMHDKLLEDGIGHMIRNDHARAEETVNRVLALNPEYPDFESIDRAVRVAARTKTPFALALPSRKALLCLGILCAKDNKTKNAEDYILDAAYSCQEARIQLLAGWFYLAIAEAEVSTGLGYFKEAVELEPILLYECDNRVQKFVRERGVEIIFGGLKPYLEMWNDFKGSIKQSQASVSSHNAAITDGFWTPLLQALDGVFAASVSGFPARLKDPHF